MRVNFTIEKTSEDGLDSEKWKFMLLDTDLVLDEYAKATRKTRRHGWLQTGRYSRLNRRDSTLTEAQVPWTQELANEALQRLFGFFHVGRWEADFHKER